MTVPTGIADVYAVAYDNKATILAVKIRRSQTVPGITNGGSPITLTANDAVTLQPISVVNAPSGFSAPSTNPSPAYVSAHGSFLAGIGFSDSTKYAAVSAADAQPGDYYTFTATSGTASQIVSTQQFQTTNGPVTLTLLAPWSPVSPAPAVFPTFTFDYMGFSAQAVVVNSAEILWGQGFDAISIFSTANHQNGATTLSIPDLTSISGFSAMAPSGTINWSTTTSGGTTQPYLNSVAPPIPKPYRPFPALVRTRYPDRADYLNAQGDWAIAPQFDGLTDFAEGLAAVSLVPIVAWEANGVMSIKTAGCHSL